MTSASFSREQLLTAIIGLEERMFRAVKSSSPSACQQHLRTFAIMRRMSHCVLSDETLSSYLQDLQSAFEPAGATGCCIAPSLSELNAPSGTELRRNFFNEKYARIEGLIPPLKQSPVIDEIVAIESVWFHDLQGRFPKLLHSSGAFESYERAELETYSDRTLDLYAVDLRSAAEQGRNMVEERYRNLYSVLGLGTLEKPDPLQGETNVR